MQHNCNKQWLALYLLLWASFAPTAPAADADKATVVERIGYAYALDTDQLIYTEHHREQKVNGQTTSADVTYKDPQGNVFATKSLDFSASQLMPDFRLLNQANGHEESALREGDTLRIVFKHPKKTDRKLELEDYPSQGVIDAGFDRWIESNWAALSTGQSLTRPFLVPSAGRFVDFAIEQSAVEEREGLQVRVITMKPASFLLRLAVSPIVVTYRADAPVLLGFEGISNMRDAAGKNYMVTIEFPGARQQASLDAAAP